MHLVPRGVAFEFFQPPFAPMRRRRAVFAAAVAMPKTSMDEDGRFIFRQHDVGADEEGFLNFEF